MKERPIDLKPHEVRGILAGRQTQIRRIVREHPINANDWIAVDYFGDGEFVPVIKCSGRKSGQHSPFSFFSRFGQPGDRLWGREAARVLRVRGSAREIDIEYQADNSVATVPYPSRLAPAPCGMLLSPGTHREASRITLDVVAVRVERLQEISEADARAEGSDLQGFRSLPDGIAGREYRISFSALWESIHGPGSWDENPWVEVCEFKRVEGGAV